MDGHEIILEGGIAAIVLWIVADKIIGPILAKVRNGHAKAPTGSDGGEYIVRITSTEQRLSKHEDRLLKTESSITEMQTNFMWIRATLERLDRGIEQMAEDMKRPGK